MTSSSLLIAVLLAATSPSTTGCTPDALQTHAESPMTDARFWSIMDASAQFEADPDTQLDALRDRLSELSPTEVLGFRDAFDRQMQRAYTWDLWGVAYVAHGGASDDGFEYFRRWLISKGQADFERVLATPDSLVDHLVPSIEGVLEFEEISYIAEEVWAEKTGGTPDAMPPSPAWIEPGTEPVGEPFDENPAALAARYPKTLGALRRNAAGLDHLTSSRISSFDSRRGQGMTRRQRSAPMRSKTPT